MKGRRIVTGSAFEDRAAYSRAVIRGDWCFVSGITGYDYATMTLADGAAAQAERCFRTLATVLREGGFEMDDLVRVTHYVRDRSDVEALLPVFRAHLDGIRPAATMVVAGLMEAEMLYEVDATALRG